MHLTEIGVIFLLESFSRAGHTGGGEEGGRGWGGLGRRGEGWGGVGRVGGGHAPSLQNTSGKLLLQSDKKSRTYKVCLNQCWPLSE